MSLEDASNPETMGAVFDKLDAWRKLDERNHIKETPTTVVGGRRVVVGSPEFYQAKADDISASNFERADARRIRDANMQLERDLRRAPPVILQPGVRAYGQDGTIIGEGIGLQAAPQPVPAPVFGQRGVALPNENGGYSVEWAPPEKQKPVLANDGSAAFDPEARDFIENKYRKVPDGAAQNEPVWDGNVGKWFVGGKVVADTELSALLTELSNIQTTTDFTDTDGSRKQAALEDARRRIEERKRVLSGGAQGAPATGTQGTQGGRRKFQG